MSPCCLAARAPNWFNATLDKSLEAVQSAADLARLNFFQRAQLASAAAWSPNPRNPPWYSDLPSKDGLTQQSVINLWTANAPLVFVHQYVGNLRQYRGIGIDVGDQDVLREGARELHEILDRYGIANSYEVYPGNHTSAVAVRFQNFVLPFFSKNLCAGTGCQ